MSSVAQDSQLIAAPRTAETWPDMFPLPGGYSLEPQPLTDKQVSEQCALWRS